MEALYLMVKTHPSTSEIAQLWVDRHEVQTIGLTLDQVLKHLQEHGWHISRLEMTPAKQGTLMSYRFEKSVAMMVG